MCVVYVCVGGSCNHLRLGAQRFRPAISGYQDQCAPVTDDDAHCGLGVQASSHHGRGGGLGETQRGTSGRRERWEMSQKEETGAGDLPVSGACGRNHSEISQDPFGETLGEEQNAEGSGFY